MTEAHPRHSLDPLIHRPVALSIVAALDAVDEADFATVRDLVLVSDSTLSKQVAALEAAGYVAVRKTFVGRRGKTYLSMTPAGRNAFRAHMDALLKIAGRTARST
ncbi:winged helix-turn-helix domain-containing protein [Cryptosporangium minutisporangium]|uniref:Transcriptional regulator n=1 Tax=Cryptosporangium minutisporangium TaxID=113569 RepID=A0ABP6SZX7_9ACTN